MRSSAVADGPVPDVVVLDVVLPGRHGTEVVRLLRDRGERVPVLLLCARDEVADRVEGLRAGADDSSSSPSRSRSSWCACRR